MAIYLDLREDFGDLPLGIDHECGPLDTHVGAPVVHLLLPDAIGLGDGVLGVRDEGVRKIVLSGEFRLGLGLVGRAADNLGINFQKLFLGVAEGAGFARAAGGVGLWEEEQNNGLTFELGE